jgi:hypothetical protein
MRSRILPTGYNRFDHIARLKTSFDYAALLACCALKAVLVHAAHLPVLSTHCLDFQWLLLAI